MANQALALEQLERGNRLRNAGKNEEAAQCFRGAVRVAPHFAEAHHNLGRVLQDLGRLREAERSYAAALDIKPDLVESVINLGNVVQSLGRYDDAMRLRRRAIRLRPDLAEVHYLAGNTLCKQGREDEAFAAYREALAINPDFAAARWAFAISQLPGVYADEAEYDRRRDAFAREVESLSAWLSARPEAVGPEMMVRQPFYLAYQEQNNRDLLSKYGAVCADLMRRWKTRLGEPPPSHKRSAAPRIAIVSAHVRDHSVWNALLKGWLTKLDRGRFEIGIFHIATKQDQETAIARQIASSFEQGPKVLGDWVRAIEAWRPDVIVYPETAMDTTTAQLASLRLAPVQVATWGHPETTGLPTIDYFISAEGLEPENAQANYTERLVLLPNLGCCYEPQSVEPTVPNLKRLGIDARSLLLVCPGTPFKYPPQHDRIFTDIAHGVGDCQFVFFTHRERDLSMKLAQRLRVRFAEAGLTFNKHVVFVPWQEREGFYGLLKRADLFLDTIGFSGFNTAMQAVECGLPIVTVEGRFLRGRLASGIMRRLGLGDLVARSAEEYADIAVKLCNDRDGRERVRARIAQKRETLFNDEASARSLQAFLDEVTRIF